MYAGSIPADASTHLLASRAEAMHEVPMRPMHPLFALRARVHCGLFGSSSRPARTRLHPVCGA